MQSHPLCRTCLTNTIITSLNLTYVQLVRFNFISCLQLYGLKTTCGKLLLVCIAECAPINGYTLLGMNKTIQICLGALCGIGIYIIPSIIGLWSSFCWIQSCSSNLYNKCHD